MVFTSIKFCSDELIPAATILWQYIPLSYHQYIIITLHYHYILYIFTIHYHYTLSSYQYIPLIDKSNTCT